MRWISRVLVVFSLGCATGYHPLGFGGGYEERQINDRSFEVWFHGNGYTRSSAAQEGAMRRSAELTVSREMAGFVISLDMGEANVSTIHQPVNCTPNGMGGVTCTGGDVQISKPSAHMVIVLLTATEAKEAITRGAIVYDAGRLLGQGPRIQRTPPATPVTPLAIVPKPTSEAPTCTDVLQAGRFVVVRCLIPSADPEETSATIRQGLRRAAVATLAAGKTHFISVGFEPAPKAGDYMIATYEVLDEASAQQRSNPLLPPERSPLSAESILKQATVNGSTRARSAGP